MKCPHFGDRSLYLHAPRQLRPLIKKNWRLQNIAAYQKFVKGCLYLSCCLRSYHEPVSSDSEALKCWGLNTQSRSDSVAVYETGVLTQVQIMQYRPRLPIRESADDNNNDDDAQHLNRHLINSRLKDLFLIGTAGKKLYEPHLPTQPVLLHNFQRVAFIEMFKNHQTAFSMRPLKTRQTWVLCLCLSGLGDQISASENELLGSHVWGIRSILMMVSIIDLLG
jgi:hypothetical protein